MAVKKFIKIDSEKGFLENKDDINYFVTSQLRKVAFGCLLGDFDENGLYVVNQKIIEELIKMPKVIVDMNEGTDLIRSKIKGDAFFHFILSVEGNKARFCLLEKINYQSNRNINSGCYSNINEYVLDEVVVPDKDFNRNVLYQKYNISTENDGDVLSIFDMDELTIVLYFNIIEKIKANYLVRNKMVLKEKEIEQIEADYFESVLEMMEEFPELQQKVLGEFKTDLKEKHSFVLPTKPFYQLTINEIFDSALEVNVQNLEDEKKILFIEKLRAIKAEYYKKYKQLLSIHIEKDAGVKFDNSKLIEESIIGSLSTEIQTKGYISSDVRRIGYNEGELQLPLSKIKEILLENLALSEKDNSRVADITKGRTKIAELYKEIQKEEIANVKDGPLIKTAIADNVSKGVEVKAGGTATAVKPAGKPEAKPVAKKPDAKAKPSAKPSAKKTAPKPQAKASAEAKPKQDEQKSESAKTPIMNGGVSSGNSTGAKKTGVASRSGNLSSKSKNPKDFIFLERTKDLGNNNNFVF